MLNLFAEAIVFDERATATFELIFLSIFVLPIYLILLIIGFKKRGKLVLNKPLVYAYVLGLPTVMIALGLTGLFGSGSVTNYEADSNWISTVLAFIIWVGLASGIVGFLGIILQNLISRHKK